MWEWLWHWTCWVNKQEDGYWMDENRLKKNMTWSGNWTYFGITRARGSFWWEVQEFSSFKNYLLPILFLILCCYLTLQWWAQHTQCMKLGRWADGTPVHIRLLFLPPYLQGFTRSRLSSFSPSPSASTSLSPWFWVCISCPDSSEPQLRLWQVELVHREKPWRHLLGDDQAFVMLAEGCKLGAKEEHLS